MLRPGQDVVAYLYAEPLDMRKSIDGLATLVEQEMQLSPMQEALFLFCNRARDKIKLLCWERNGSLHQVVATCSISLLQERLLQYLVLPRDKMRLKIANPASPPNNAS